MDKIKILALFGKSGTGKDTIQDWMVSHLPNTNKIVSCTTRPKRDYEIDEIDYFFLTPETFAEKVLNESMLEATCFNNWFYGTSIDSLKADCVNIGVFNIQGIDILMKDSRLDILPVRIDVDDVIRLKRSLSREKNPDCREICRRFLVDEEDFLTIPFGYLKFNNTKKNNDFNDFCNMPLIADFLTLDKND